MTIAVGTNSYVTEAELTAYATARGVSISGDTEELLIKAMDYIESLIFSGAKYDSDQDLEFPRTPTDQALSTTVPPKIEKAQMVIALLIDSGESMFPTVDRSIQREKAGNAVEVEYMPGASETKRFTEVQALLGPYLASSSNTLIISD